MATIQTIKLTGLHCPACQKIIEKRFSKIPGVLSVSVTLVNNQAMITASDEITPAQLQIALEGTAYTIVL